MGAALDVRHLDLFSGIGGFALAARWVGWETVAFCEIDDYCQAVLAKHWPSVPIHNDVRELSGDAIGHVDIITGGYPCQPFSLAGKRRGENDDRHLWPEMHRLINELRPAWVVGENVAGHITMGLDRVLSDLEGSGYACRTFAIPAVAVDAKHRRERLWIVANTSERRLSEPSQGEIQQPGRGETVGASSSTNAGCTELREQPGRGSGSSRASAPESGNHGPAESLAEPESWNAWQEPGSGSRWLPEPDVGRVVNGMAHRAYRVEGCGDGQVPLVAAVAWDLLTGDL